MSELDLDPLGRSYRFREGPVACVAVEGNGLDGVHRYPAYRSPQ